MIDIYVQSEPLRYINDNQPYILPLISAIAEFE